MDDALSIAVPVAAALEAAHAAGIVHRDLKPENILLGADGRVRVVDFGIALLSTDQAAPGAARLTAAGGVFGTPAYMSPEQVEGREVDFRSDQFSFGAVLHEMVAGSNPFEADTPFSVAARVVAAEPRPLADLAPSVPPALEAIVCRCLAKHAADRYARTADLAADLVRLAADRETRRVEQADRGAAGGRDANRVWWVIHQAAVVLFFVILFGLLRWASGWIARPWNGVLTVAFVIPAVVNAILRANLLFTARFQPPGLAAQLRRTRPSILASDLLANALLVAASAATAPGSHHHRRAAGGGRHRQCRRGRLGRARHDRSRLPRSADARPGSLSAPAEPRTGNWTARAPRGAVRSICRRIGAPPGDSSMRSRPRLRPIVFAGLVLALAFVVPVLMAADQAAPSAAKASAAKPPVHAKQVKRLLIRNAMVIYGNAKPPFGPANIVVEDGLIARVGAVPRDWVADAVIDATGKYVHARHRQRAHAPAGRARRRPAAVPVRDEPLPGRGVTTVRDVGADCEKAKKWRADSNAHTLVAPRILVYERIWAAKGSQTPALVREGVRCAKAEGVDGLKSSGIDRDLLEAFLDEAHKQNLRTATHIAVEETTAKDFAELGVTSIEHFYGVADAALDGIQDFPPEHNASNEVHRFGRAGELYIQHNLNREKLVGRARPDGRRTASAGARRCRSTSRAATSSARRTCPGTRSTSTRRWSGT